MVKISSKQTVRAGVPQGSVLEPLLFLIYVNDMVKEIKSNIRLFADELQFGLFSVPTSGPQLVYQRPWYVLFCLWKSACKRSLAAYRKE